MTDIWTDVKSAFASVDAMVITCHSDQEGLYLISKYRKGELPDSERYIEMPFDWSGINWNPGAWIKLMSCQAGGRNGHKWQTCIAQDIANKTGATVWGFCCRSSQQKRADGYYYQKPDLAQGYVKFERMKHGTDASSV